MKKISEINVFRAFRSRDYSLYFVGRAVSQFGTWMQRTAVVWLVYSITHSALLLGATIFAEQFPSFVFSIPGGVLADRYDRYTIIKITQVVSMIQSIMLAVLVLTGHSAIWAILALSVLLGIINAFDVPARQSLIHDVVTDKSDLSNAVSLTTATACLAQLLGPAIAGLVLNAWGASVCFFINAASFGGVFISVVLMNIPPPRPGAKKRVLAEFAEGFQYLRTDKNLSTIIFMLALTSLLVLPYNTVLPVFAKVVFHGDASTFGYITSFVGVGAVIGTVYLATRKQGAPLKKILFICGLIMSIGMICFSRITYFPVAMFFAVLTGFGSMAQFTISNIIVQSGSAPQMRGRVIGIMLMALFGMAPIGSLVVGAVSERIGAPATVLGQGIIGIIITFAFIKFLLRPEKSAVVKDADTAEMEEMAAER